MISTEEALPTATTPPASRLIRANNACREMIDFLSVMTGERPGNLLYRLLRAEVRNHSEEVSWTPAPAPFVVRPTSIFGGWGVLLWNPHIGSSVLTGTEAVGLSEAITAALNGKSGVFALVPTVNNVPGNPPQASIRIIRGGRYVTISIGDKSYPMSLEAARDLVQALADCSAHAVPVSLSRAIVH